MSDLCNIQVNHEEDFHLEGCYKYADIQEEAFRRRIAICGGQTGYRHIYTSMGDVVELFLYSGQQFSFLIEFKGEFKYFLKVLVVIYQLT